MPKQLYKITQFHGGLNSNSDARDIAENELSEATDVMVDELGKIRMMGGTAAQGTAARTNAITPGYGLFQFSHDREGGEDTGSSEDETGADYLVFSDSDTTGVVSIYSAVDTAWGNPITGLTDNTAGTAQRKDAFYIVDGSLRICDSEFRNANTNKWYGYISRKHFTLVDYDVNAANVNDGDTLYTYSGWYLKDQELAAPTKGLMGDDMSLGLTTASSSSSTIRLLHGTASGGSTTTLVDTDGSGSNDSFEHFNANEIDGEGYIVTNRGSSSAKHSVYGTITALTDDETLTMSGALSGSIAFASGDIYDIYPAAGTGFNLSFSQSNSTSGTFNVSGGSVYYLFAAAFVYEGGQESTLYTYDTLLSGGKYHFPTATVQNNKDLTVDVLCTAPFDPRITGARIYYKEVTLFGGFTGSDWLLMFDLDLNKGLRTNIFTNEYKGWQCKAGVNTPWEDATTRLFLGVTQTVTAQSTLTRTAVTGYTDHDETSSVRYKTAVITNRRAYIGNVKYIDFNSISHTKGDAVIKSPVNQFDVFPTSGLIEASVNDGDNIIKLEEYADRLLIFKKNKLELLNISQDVEFLEDIFMHKGISHPAAACKTDFGIAWVNRRGCYLYDGQKITNLLEKQGRQIIKESDWDSFTTDNSIIGYVPRKRQLIVLKDCTATSTGDIYLFDMVTQSWVKGDTKFTDSQIQTNFVTDWNGDLVHAHTSDTGTVVKWDDAADTSTAMVMTTKDIDFGHPGQVKRIYKFYITYKVSGTSNLSLSYFKNGLTTGAISSNPFVNTSGAWSTISYSVAGSSFSCYSMQLRIKSSGGATPADFEINDITIVFRLKGQR